MDEINKLSEKLLSTQRELEALNAKIKGLYDTRSDDPVQADALLSYIAFLESMKATLERIAIGRAFMLSRLLQEKAVQA